MDSRISQIEYFFDAYAELFNNGIKGAEGITEATAACFSDSILAVNPAGINCGANDERFLEAIPQGYTFYRDIGIEKMSILTKAVTILDGFHALVKILWRSDYARKDGTKGNIGFENIYFIRDKDQAIKIFAYITGDEQKALREHGLV